VQLTPHFNYTSKYDKIKCPCEKCKDDSTIQIDTAILWVAEAIRTYLNAFHSGHIVLRVTSGCRCLPYHYSLYQKKGKSKADAPIRSRHLFTPSAKSDALDIVPLDKKERYTTNDLLNVVERYYTDWPGGFHVYRSQGFFHIDLGDGKRRW